MNADVRMEKGERKCEKGKVMWEKRMKVRSKCKNEEVKWDGKCEAREEELGIKLMLK